MGVIYKLKQEIIDFIVKQKNDNVKLSCRAIAQSIHEKFQVEVSKSSVNAILKEASLSSPVGRRRGAAATNPQPKRSVFQIPAQKKQEINESIKSFIQTQNVKIETKPIIITKTTTKELREIKEIQEKQSAPEVFEQEEKLPLLPDLNQTDPQPLTPTTIEAAPANIFQIQIDKTRSEILGLKGPLFDGMGLIFIQALEWEIFGGPFLDNIISKIPALNNQEFKSYLFAAKFFPLLQKSPIDDFSVYKNHAITMLEAGRQTDITYGLKSLEELRAPDNVIIDFNFEMMQARFALQSFKIYFENDSAIFIDPYFESITTVLRFTNVFCPVNKAMDRLSRALIHSLYPIIISTTKQGSFDPEAMRSLLGYLNQEPGFAVKRIEALSQNQEILASFESLLFKEKIFIWAVDPARQEFSELTKNVKWAQKHPYYLKWHDQVIYYSDIQEKTISLFQINEKKYRFIFVYADKNTEARLFLMTNNHRDSVEKILDEMFLTQPDCLSPSSDDKGIWQNCLWKKGSSQYEQTTIASLVKEYAYFLEEKLIGFLKYSEPNININEFISNVYNIPGHIYQYENCLIVELITTKSYRYSALVHKIAAFFNKKMIYDSNKNRLIIIYKN